MPSAPSIAEAELEKTLLLATAPVHKRALGVAVGLLTGLGVAVPTAVAVILQPDPMPRLDLLQNFFLGYTVTWSGVGIGFLWAFGVGFVAGWFVAFVRNFVTAVWLFFVRTKAQFSRNFLDHI